MIQKTVVVLSYFRYFLLDNAAFYVQFGFSIPGSTEKKFFRIGYRHSLSLVLYINQVYLVCYIA